MELISEVVTVPVLAAWCPESRVELQQPPSSRVEQSDAVRLPAAGMDTRVPVWSAGLLHEGVESLDHDILLLYILIVSISVTLNTTIQHL